eukprot:1976432-Rhodomonas_salina.3
MGERATEAPLSTYHLIPFTETWCCHEALELRRSNRALSQACVDFSSGNCARMQAVSLSNVK